MLRVRDNTDSYYVKMKDLPDLPMRMLIVGKSFLSGKSTVILNLLLREEYYRGLFKGDNVYIVSNNEMDQKMRILRDTLEIPPENFISFTEEGVEDIYEQVEEDCIAAIDAGEKPVQSIIILDDVAFSGSLKKKVDGIVSRIACNGRHICLSMICTAQKYTQLSTVLRVNCTSAVLFANTQKESELMSEDFNYMPDKRDFMKMYRTATKERNAFLAVDFTSDDIYRDSQFRPIVMDS